MPITSYAREQEQLVPLFMGLGGEVHVEVIRVLVHIKDESLRVFVKLRHAAYVFAGETPLIDGVTLLQRLMVPQSH